MEWVSVLGVAMLMIGAVALGVAVGVAFLGPVGWMSRPRLIAGAVATIMVVVGVLVLMNEALHQRFYWG